MNTSIEYSQEQKGIEGNQSIRRHTLVYVERQLRSVRDERACILVGIQSFKNIAPSQSSPK